MEPVSVILAASAGAFGYWLGNKMVEIWRRRRVLANAPAHIIGLNTNQPAAAESWQLQYETYGAYQRHMAERGVLIPENRDEAIGISGLEFVELYEVGDTDGTQTFLLHMRRKAQEETE